MTTDLFGRLATLASSLVLLSGIGILWRRSLPAYIRAFRRQSMVFVLATLVVAWQGRDPALYLVAALVFALKVVFIPRVLERVRRHVGSDQEVRPYVNAPISLLTAGALTVAAYAVARPVMALSDLPTRGGIPLALATVFVGLFIVASRRNALSQIVGFLIMENGIALLAVLATYGVPFIVELGSLLDVLLAFLVMQVFVYRIREAHPTLEVDRMRALRR